MLTFSMCLGISWRASGITEIPVPALLQSVRLRLERVDLSGSQEPHLENDFLALCSPFPVADDWSFQEGKAMNDNTSRFLTTAPCKSCDLTPASLKSSLLQGPEGLVVG
jgi:hypothetical protein